MKRIHSRFTLKTVCAAFALLVFALPGVAQVITNSNPISFKRTLGDKLSLYDNRINNSRMYGLGVESNAMFMRSNGAFRFYSGTNANDGNNSIFSIRENGHVGIGTDLPYRQLQIHGHNPVVSLRDQYSNNQTYAARIELLEYDDGLHNDGAFIHYNGYSDRLTLGTIGNGATQSLIMINHGNENVGIGTYNKHADFKLLVGGDIRAEEFIVETGWADYVFEDDYLLRSLEEVEAFIAENGHLPDVPAAEEVESNGVRMGEMEATLLRKIEELTLYLIDLEKSTTALQEKVTQLRSQE